MSVGKHGMLLMLHENLALVTTNVEYFKSSISFQDFKGVFF